MVCLWRGSREAVEDANGGHHSHLGKCAQPARRQVVWRSCAVAWSDPARDIGGHTYAGNGRTPAAIFFLSLPLCFPGFVERSGEAKNAPKGRSKRLISLRKFGAGEGIRTLDPNLGKVVLYP